MGTETVRLGRYFDRIRLEPVRSLHCRRLATPMQADLLLRREDEVYADPATKDVLLCLLTGGRLDEASLDFGAGRIRGRFEPGALFLAMDGHAHALEGRGPFDLLTLALPADRLRERLDTAAPGFVDFGALHAGSFRDPETEALLRTLWRTAHDAAPGSSLRTDGMLSLLLARLLDLSGHAYDEAVHDDAALPRQTMETVRANIHANLTDGVRLDDLAALAGCSVFQLTRRFKQAFGCAPYAYLTRLRVERARSMLTSPKPRALSDIAHDCGFSDQAHMTRVFRRHLGITPAAYRRTVGT